ncbi:MAG: hypothetical protein V1735_05530 [Nanoarchaeota archaeon]
MKPYHSQYAALLLAGTLGAAPPTAGLVNANDTGAHNGSEDGTSLAQRIPAETTDTLGLLVLEDVNQGVQVSGQSLENTRAYSVDNAPGSKANDNSPQGAFILGGGIAFAVLASLLDKYVKRRRFQHS